MGIIQNAINQVFGTAAIAARLSPELEEQAKNIKLKKEEERLSGALTQLQEHTFTPKGMNQQEAAEYETKIADELTKELEKTQFELAKRGAGGFEKVLETKDIRSHYELDPVSANNKAAEKQEQQKQQKEDNKNFVKFITDPGQLESEFKQLKGGKTYGK